MNLHLKHLKPLIRTGEYFLSFYGPSFLAAALLLLGTFLRFMQMGDIRYGYDHSYPAYQALQLLDGRQLPFIGQPSSVFLDNPALMVYLQAIPLLIYRSPWSVFIFIIALNSLAVWFIYLLARDLLGVRVGLVAAFLFAINPWVVFFSRTSWVQSLLPFLMAVIAWGLWPMLVDPNASAKRFFVGGTAVTLLTQTYIQAWGILPQLTLLLLFFRRYIPKRAFWTAVALFLLAGLLYVGGLATRWDVNGGKLANFVAADAFTLSAIGARHALRFVTGIDFEQAYAAADSAGSWRATLSLVAVIVLTIAVIAGIGRALLALRRGGTEQRIAIILLVWFFMPVLLTAVAGSLQIHPHYLLLTVPAGHILAAWGMTFVVTTLVVAPAGRAAVGRQRLNVVDDFQSLLRTGAADGRQRLKSLLRTATILTLLLIGIFFSHDLIRANRNVARQPVQPQFDGWSLAAGSKVGRAIGELLDPHAAYPKRIIANGDKALLSGLSGTYLDIVNGVEYPDFVLLSPGENLLYVLEGEAAVPEWLRPLVVARPEHTLTFANGAPISFVQTAATAAQSIQNYPQETVLWPSEAGITLIGYTMFGKAQPSQSFDLITYWRVDDLHPDRGEWYVSPTYHLVNDQEQIVANVGEHGQYAHRWQLGDVYVERVTIPIAADAPSGSYRLDISLFDVLRSQGYQFFSSGIAKSHFSIVVDVRPPEEAHLYHTSEDE